MYTVAMEQKTEVRNARFEKSLLNKLEAIAKREERSVSFLIHKAVQEFVDKREVKVKAAAR